MPTADSRCHEGSGGVSETERVQARQIPDGGRKVDEQGKQWVKEIKKKITANLRRLHLFPHMCAQSLDSQQFNAKI